MKEDGTYFQSGLEWNFCKYLPGTEYYASLIEETENGLNTEILTNSEPTPYKISEIDGGLKVIWASEE